MEIDWNNFIQCCLVCMVGLFGLLLFETHRANKLVDEVDALMKKLEDLNNEIRQR